MNGSVRTIGARTGTSRSEEHTSELQSLRHLVCRLLLEKKEKTSVLQSLRHLVCCLLFCTAGLHECCARAPSPPQRMTLARLLLSRSSFFFFFLKKRPPPKITPFPHHAPFRF